MKTIGLVVKRDKTAARQAKEFEKWLIRQGHAVCKKENSYNELDIAEKNQFQVSVQAPIQAPIQALGQALGQAPTDLFCVFVLGGDGTFLSAVRWIGDQKIPIMGIKFGEVGFLAETAADKLFSVAKTILTTKFQIISRMRLTVKVSRKGKPRAAETVLNDLVINKGALARLAHIKTFINEQHLTDYRADGLIIATPTGSTAYSLAAGGPIIHPAVPGILLTPICPFTLTNRPLIVPQASVIKIRLAERSSDIMLTFDGQKGLAIDERDIIIVEKSLYPVQMIAMQDQDYFDILKAKLRWSGSRI